MQYILLMVGEIVSDVQHGLLVRHPMVVSNLCYADLKETLMECREPDTIRDEELLAYLSGENVRPIVAQHLDRCERCASLLTEYRRIELTLTSKLYRWDCPPNQMLGDYQLGLVSGEIATAVKFHLGQCVLCAAEVATLTEFLANDPMLVERAPVARVSVRSSSPNNHRSAQEAKRVVEQLREHSAASVRHIIATLLPPQPQIAYSRNSVAAELWPRSYTAEDLSISLFVERGASRKDGLKLSGLVKRAGVALETLRGIPVQLSSQANTAYIQNIDELGNFVFSPILPATYTLELQFPDSVIVIEQLPVSVQD